MIFTVRIKIISIFAIVFLVACNDSSEIGNKYIELGYCLHVDVSDCTDEEIVEYADFFSSKKIKVETEKSATINNLCLLVERYEKIEFQMSHNVRDDLVKKIEPKMNSTKYNYIAYKDCRKIFDLKFVSPKN
jgi:hypothetical protein